MENYSFHSLREMLESPPNKDPNFFGSFFSSSSSLAQAQAYSKSNEESYVIEMFGELYFKEGNISSMQSFFPTLPSLSLSPAMAVASQDETVQANGNVEEAMIYNKKNNEVEKEKKGASEKPKVANGPINSKKEKTRVPNGGIFRGSKEDGRLKADFANPSEGGEVKGNL